MKRQVTILVLIGICQGLIAQTNLRVHYKDGTRVDIPLSMIDSLTFEEVATDTAEAVRAVLTGDWVWGSTQREYYEVLTFNEDRTFTGYDNYFTYGFDTWTYGWYAQLGTMLTMWSNGFGYQRRYNWFMMGLSANALEVMTQMGPFTYYRLQPEVLRMTTEAPLPLAEGDSVVFADGVVVAAEGASLHALTAGTTYVLIRRQATGEIGAYKVVVAG